MTNNETPKTARSEHLSPYPYCKLHRTFFEYSLASGKVIEMDIVPWGSIDTPTGITKIVHIRSKPHRRHITAKIKDKKQPLVD